MRRFVAATAMLGLLMAGAGIAGASTGSGRSAAPGVTKKAIDLGVTYVDLAGTDVNIELGDWEAMYNAVIDDVNANDGINGRDINPVFAPVSPVGTVPAQEACVKLTEDQQVFAVIGFFLADAPLCYVAQHDTPVLGGVQSAEALAQAKAPWFSLEANDDRFAQVLEAFAADGKFKKGETVGIISDASSQGLLDDVVLPKLDELKVKSTTAEITAAQGDTVATEQQAGVIAERFDTDGIKTVLIVGQTAIQFGNALAATDYRPTLLVLGENILRSFVQQEGSDLTVVKDAITAAPVIDFDDPDLQACFGLITDATGYEIEEVALAGEPEYRRSSEIVCRAVAFFEQLASGAGKNPTSKSLAKAPAKLGSIEIPGSGTMTYNKKTKQFEAPIFIYRLDADSGELTADSKPAT